MLFGIIVLMVGLASSLQAGGIINKQNLSADYIRTLNRNAATDMADAAAFNPAGTAMMQDGLYVKADAIYLWKDYSNQMPSIPAIFNLGTLESDEPSIIPGFFAVYKQDRWAGFFGVTVPGGGGEVRYQDGDARTVILSAPGAVGGLGTYLGGPTGNPTNINQYIEASSEYVGLQPGRRLQGLRFAFAFRRCALCRSPPEIQRPGERDDRARQTVNVKIEREDDAYNYFLGMDYAPIKDLNFAFTYMSNTALNFKADTNDNSPGQAVSRQRRLDGRHPRA